MPTAPTDEAMTVTTGIRSAKLHRAIAKATGAVEIRTEPVGEVWSKFGPPNRGYPLYIYPDGNEMMLGASHENAYRDGTGGGIYIDVIAIKNRGGGLGQRVMAALKGYADSKAAKLVVYKVTNAAFFSKFPWLTNKHGDFQYVPPEPTSEAFATYVKDKYAANNDEPLPIYKNPTAREVREIDDKAVRRGLLSDKDGTVYVFPSNVLHGVARDALNLARGEWWALHLYGHLNVRTVSLDDVRVGKYGPDDVQRLVAPLLALFPGCNVVDAAGKSVSGGIDESFVEATDVVERINGLLGEDYEPDEVERAATYYHGSSDFAVAEKAFREGLKSRELQGAPKSRAQLAPMHDRVYMTRELRMGAIYAVGGDVRKANPFTSGEHGVWVHGLRDEFITKEVRPMAPQRVNMYRCKACNAKFISGVNCPPSTDMQHFCVVSNINFAEPIAPGTVRMIGECEYIGVYETTVEPKQT